jgi:hypothetical protein
VPITFVPITFVPITFVPITFVPITFVPITFVPITFVLFIKVQKVFKIFAVLFIKVLLKVLFCYTYYICTFYKSIFLLYF